MKQQKNILRLIVFLAALSLTSFTAFGSSGSNASPLKFQSACEPGEHTVVAAVGDILLHRNLQEQALSSTGSFQGLFDKVEAALHASDVTYANLEGPVATGVSLSLKVSSTSPGTYDNNILTGYPMFNYHPDLIPVLVKGGFSVVSTANNHALDRGAIGIDRTIQNLNQAGLSFAGTRMQSTSNKANDDRYPWFTVTESNGIRLAWVACTMLTNGFTDKEAQLLQCNADRQAVLSTISKLSKNKRYADAVILTPHWGIEYKDYPSVEQKAFARDAVEAGATAVIGNHPHVLEPWEKIVTSAGKEAFVIYSIGNFISGQDTVEKRSSIILYLGLTKRQNGDVSINGARYLPIYTNRRSDTGIPGVFVEIAANTESGSSSIAHVERLFPTQNRLDPGEPIITNPECARAQQSQARGH